MPSPLSLFRHSRDKLRPAKADDGGQKSTVKKRLRSLSMVVPGSSSRAVLRSVSLNSAPEPLELIGSSKTADVPELPSFPLYQHFSSTRHVHDPNKRGQRYEGSVSRENRRLSRVATVSDFHSQRPHGESVSSNHGAATPSSRSDRAVELARLYRSILPDFHAVCEEEQADEMKKRERRENERDGREASEYGGQRSKNGGPSVASVKSISQEERDERKDGTLCQPARANELPHHPTSGSSLPVTSETSGVKHKIPDGVTQRQRSLSEANMPSQIEHAWPLPTRSLSPPSSAPRATPEITKAELVGEPENERDDLSILSQHGAVGLQICTELLVDRLVKALGLRQHEKGQGESNHDHVKEGSKARDKQKDREGENGMGHRESSKQLEMLLLIEAYEGLLRCCRREAAAAITTKAESAETGPHGNGMQAGTDRKRSRCVAEAVPILEHWLETLHALYEATFEEDEET